jgi:hypothetical protein
MTLEEASNAIRQNLATIGAALEAQRVKGLTGTERFAEGMREQIDRLNNPVATAGDPPAAKPSNMGLSDGQAAYARGLKLPGEDASGGAAPMAGKMGLTDAQAAYARGLKLPA